MLTEPLSPSAPSAPSGPPERPEQRAGQILLPPALSGHCAVLTEYAFTPSARPPAPVHDELAAAREQVRADFVAGVLDALLAAYGDDALDLRPGARAPAPTGPALTGPALTGPAPTGPAPTGPAPTDATLTDATLTDATLTALRDGVGLIVGPLLLADPATGRTGSPSALLRGRDGGYAPVEVHWHRVTAHRRPRDDPRGDDSAQQPLTFSTLDRPERAGAGVDLDLALRLGSRAADFLALASYHRLLRAAGFAGDSSWAAVIGTDLRAGRPFLAWVDLAFAQVRTFSRSAAEGWRLRSLLVREDHEHRFRLKVARAAADGRRVVEPVVNRECASCPWWETCRARLDPGEVSLRIEKGALDVREIVTLRRLGIRTIDDLIERDLFAAATDELLQRYLSEVTHRRDAEQRLRTAVRRATMLVSGQALQRDSLGPIAIAAASTEIDLDIETSADGRVYLWGFLVQRAGSEPRYLDFSRFADLDDAGELSLAAEALGWLRDQVRDGDCRVYHYSGYEVAMIAALAARTTDETLQWATGYAATQFVDLFGIVAQHFFGASGLGLKLVAQHAGFRWRDQDPGGLNSQVWFADAVHGLSTKVRNQARQRVLDYNEDDVAATAALRAWLRAQ